MRSFAKPLLRFAGSPATIGYVPDDGEAMLLSILIHGGLSHAKLKAKMIQTQTWLPHSRAVSRL